MPSLDNRQWQYHKALMSPAPCINQDPEMTEISYESSPPLLVPKTDQPTFFLQQVIGRKFGMSNQEVQVSCTIPVHSSLAWVCWELQDRPLPPNSEQDPSPASHGRQKSSSSELLLLKMCTMLKRSISPCFLVLLCAQHRLFLQFLQVSEPKKVHW
jgi:hypothetical protein